MTQERGKGGVVSCAVCGWYGVPTYLNGTPSPVCPACKQEAMGDWACIDCGATTGRYDNGDACTDCVMASFAESG